MTIRELRNAIAGFTALETERFELAMRRTRIESFWSFKGHAGKKLRSYEQIMKFASDIKARQERLKGVKEVEIYDEQSNG